MRFYELFSSARYAVATGAALVALSGSAAFGQNSPVQLQGWKPTNDAIIIDNCPSPATAAPSSPALQAAPAQPSTPRMDDPSLSAERSGAFGGEQTAFATPNMFGDFIMPSGGFSGSRSLRLQPNQYISPGNPPFLITNLPNGSFTQVPLANGVSSSSVRAVSASHSFKISDNNNALPQDRVLFNYNYYNDINGGLNRANGIPGTTDAHIETFGFEKTFLNGRASVGLSLPLQTLADSVGDAINTDIGNLSFFGKFMMFHNCDTGSAFSAGLAVTVPTGPTGFAGSDVSGAVNNTILQPYVSYIFRRDAFYVLGFSGVAIATDSKDVNLLFNDISVGYFLRDDKTCERFVTAIVPTVELHVNTPLNHNGAGDFTDPYGTADWISVTGGVTLQFGGKSSLAIGMGVPITGPQPYALEALAQFNYRF